MRPQWYHNFCLKMSKQELWEACQTSEWMCHFSNPADVTKLQNLIKNAGAKGANTASRRLKYILCSYPWIPFVDIMILSFWSAYNHHGPILLNMRYNTTLIAISVD